MIMNAMLTFLKKILNTIENIFFYFLFEDYFEENDDGGPGTQQEQGWTVMDPSLR